MQIFMLIFTIVFAFWGILTLVYDKIISISTVVKDLMLSIFILVFVLIVLFVIAILSYVLFNNTMYSYIGKKVFKRIKKCTRKCSGDNYVCTCVEDIFKEKKIYSKDAKKKILGILEIMNFTTILLLNYNPCCEETIESLIGKLEKIEL